MVRSPWPGAQEHQQQHDRVRHAGERGADPRLDVDDGAHRGSRCRQTRDQTSTGVAESLANQLPVGVVVGLAEVVGHQGGQQRVDRSEQGEYSAGFEHDRPMLTEVGKRELQTTLGNAADPGQGGNAQLPESIVVEQQQGEWRHDQQCQQG